MLASILLFADAICAFGFTIASVVLFIQGNYLGSLAAIALGTNFEWAVVRALRRKEGK